VLLRTPAHRYESPHPGPWETVLSVIDQAAVAQRLRGRGPLPHGPLDPGDGAPASQAALRAWLRLHAALCLRPAFALDMLERSAGDPAAALSASGELLPCSEGELGERVRGLARAGFRALPVCSPDYPEALRTLVDAPPLLFVCGDAAALGRRSVAIVGARAATSYGLGVARGLSAALAARGIAVVSGLARGVDAAAHRGALAAGGPTVAVQGCGPDVVYPAEHRRLRAEIAGGGAVISELPLGARPRAAFFPLRNRLISGLAEIVIVVEARERSGSLITARHAADQGREVMAVPGPLTMPTSGGSNRLLRDGATPLLELSDVIDRLEAGSPLPVAGEPAAIAPSERSRPQQSPPDAAARLLIGLLEHEPMDREALARRLDWPTERVESVLLELELEGLVQEDRDARLRPRPGGLFDGGGSG